MGLGDIGCMGHRKSFHIKILLLDKQELIQEVQVGSFGFMFLVRIPIIK